MNDACLWCGEHHGELHRCDGRAIFPPRKSGGFGLDEYAVNLDVSETEAVARVVGPWLEPQMVVGVPPEVVRRLRREEAAVDETASFPEPDIEAPLAPGAVEPAPGDDELLRAVGQWVDEFTTDLRAVSAGLTRQREETRRLMDAQRQATTLVLDAVRALPTRLGPKASVPGEPDVVVLRPEVVEMESIEPVRPDAVNMEVGVDAAGDGAGGANG